MSNASFVAAGSAALVMCLAAQSAEQPPARNLPPPPTVLALDSFVLVAQDLDRTLRFYRDVVGLRVVVAPRAREIDPARNRVTDTTNAKRRYAVLQVPNEPFALELDEYTGIERSNVRAQHNDPGSSFMNFGVWDADAAFDVLRRSKPELVGTAPIPAAGAPGLNAVWIRDPDGHLVEMMQGGWDPERKSMVGLDRVYRSHFGMTMPTYQDALTFYRDLLGFDLTAGFPPMVAAGQYMSAKGLSAMLNVPAESSMTGVAGHCAYARCEMFEFKGGSRTVFHPRLQDPGAAFLSMWVSDLDGLLATLKAGNLEVVTTGGNPVTVAAKDLTLYPGRDTQGPVRVHHSRDVMVRDPGGFPILLRQRVD